MLQRVFNLLNKTKITKNIIMYFEKKKTANTKNRHNNRCRRLNKISFSVLFIIPIKILAHTHTYVCMPTSVAPYYIIQNVQ